MEFRAGQVTLDIFDPASHRPALRAEPGGARAPSAGRRRDARRARGEGVEFDGETIDTGVCHLAFFHDPDGNSLMLHRRYAPRD